MAVSTVLFFPHRTVHPHRPTPLPPIMDPPPHPTRPPPPQYGPPSPYPPSYNIERERWKSPRATHWFRLCSCYKCNCSGGCSLKRLRLSDQSDHTNRKRLRDHLLIASAMMASKRVLEAATTKRHHRQEKYSLSGVRTVSFCC